jgi:hypothetical protein
MERRLLVAATWFAEHLSRHRVGRVDALFASEAMNLAEFFRLRPQLAKKPSVVYFHDNQMPDPDQDGVLESPTDLVNLSSATAATEIWFNSLYNLRTFLSRASGMVARHPELQNANPLPKLTAKAHLVPPPIDLATAHAMALEAPADRRDPRFVLVDARRGDHQVLRETLEAIARRRERIHLTVIGRLDGLPDSLRPTVLDERDHAAHADALTTTSVLLSARTDAAADDLVVRAMTTGCLPIVPNSGVYPDLLPEAFHERCLHDGTARSLVSLLLDAWYLARPGGYEMHVEEAVAPFDAINACKVIDERLEKLAAGTVSVRVATGRSRVAVSMS